jgi:predicted ester cyclase
MGLEENKRIVRRLLEEGIAKEDMSVLDELIAAPDVREEWDRKLAAFAELELSAEHMIAEGDEVWTRGVFKGLHRHDFGPYVASGRFVELPYMDWWIVRDGRIVANWGVWNGVALVGDPATT